MTKWAVLVAAILLVGCSSQQSDDDIEGAVRLTVEALASTTPAATATAKASSTPLPTETPVPSPTVTLEPTATPLSEAFKSRLNTFLADGARVSASTEQGVNYNEFGNYVTEALGSYDLLTSTWPDDLMPEVRAQFDDAFTGWDLLHYLWRLNIDDSDNPVAPDINGYAVFIDYAEKPLLIDTHPNDADLYCNLGILYQVKGDNIKAQQALQKALQLDPGNKRALAALKK